MKFQFKWYLLFFLLITTVTHARDIILVENLASASEGEMLMNIIQQKFKIPRKLITYRSINQACMEKSEAIMHLCLKQNGELEVVKVNRFVVENSLRVFLEGGE